MTELGRPNPMREFPAPDLPDKLNRALWNIVNATLYRVPVPLFGLRRALLRVFGARIAADAMPYAGARIWAPRNLVMEAGSCIADGVVCYNVATVTLGAGAIVSQRAHLCTPSHDYRLQQFPLVAAEIKIGANAWIAAEAFVGPGVSIGRDAVVCARAVVTRSVPENTVMAGNPALPVGSRYPADKGINTAPYETAHGG